MKSGMSESSDTALSEGEDAMMDDTKHILHTSQSHHDIGSKHHHGIGSTHHHEKQFISVVGSFVPRDRSKCPYSNHLYLETTFVI